MAGHGPMDRIDKLLRIREKTRSLDKHDYVILTACEHLIIRLQVTVMALVNDVLTMPMFMTTKNKSSEDMGALSRYITRALHVRTSIQCQ